MSMFDSVINESSQKFGLGDKAGSLLSSLLSLMTDQSRGGFAGFLDRFRTAGLGEAVNSWIGNGNNLSISNEQVETALGTDTINLMAQQAGADVETTKSALGTMIPGVVDRLTPEGAIPTEDDLLSRIGGFLSGVGGATVSTTGVMMSDSIDRSGTAAAEEINRSDISINLFRRKCKSLIDLSKTLVFLFSPLFPTLNQFVKRFLQFQSFIFNLRVACVF